MKKIMSMMATAVFAVVAGVNVYNAQTTELAMSDLQMENLEALADGENNSGTNGRQWWHEQECDCYDPGVDCLPEVEVRP